MTSDAQKAAGYLLPNPLTGYPTICVSFLMPDALEYRGAVRGQLKALGDWWMWEKSYLPGDRRAAQAARIFEQLIAETLVFGVCNPEQSGCVEHPPSSYIIEYNPNDPYRTPDLIPDGYAFPPWYQATVTTGVTLGTSLGDVVTDITRTSSAPIIPPASGYPRFRIHLNGEGVVNIHLVKLNGAGYAQITTDDDVLSAEFVSLAKDVISIPPESTDDIIIERKIETPGTHHIDVLFIPQVTEELPFIGQGGALRKIVLCGFDDMARNVELQDIEAGDGCFQIQWKYTDESADAWRNLGNPVCNGQDGTNGQDGAPGADGQDGLTPELRLVSIDALCKQVEWKYTTENETAWRALGVVCDGEDGEDGAPGADGAPGEQGPPGEPGADGVCPDCPPIGTVPGEETDPDTSANNCAGAVGVVETLLSILNYNLDQLEFAGAVTYGVINLVSLNIIEFLSSIPLVGTVISALEFALEIGVGDIRNRINNPDFKEELICWLYCEVEKEGAFNQTSFNAWIAKINEEYSSPFDGAKTFVDLAQNVIGYEAISRRYAIESLNTDARCEALCDCQPCAVTEILVINCKPENNNTMIPAGWIASACAASPSRTAYDTQSIMVTLDQTRLIKRIRVNWRSAFDPAAPMATGNIVLNGVTYTKAYSSSNSERGNLTPPQEITDLFVEASSFEIYTTGTVNEENPAGYVSFFSISVEYCVEEGV